MSANLPTSDIPSDHLDYSVLVEDQNEVSSVSLTESSVTISVSVAEISSDEVKVSSGGENLVETLPQSSDLCVEENLNEEVVQLEDSVLPEVSVSGNEERQTGIEVVRAECSVVITESSIDRIEVVVGEQVEVMEKEGVSKAKDGVSEINALDENTSCIGKDGNLEAETVGGSTEALLNEDIRLEESTSLQDEKQETVALVAEIVSNQVDCDERLVLHSVKENQNDGASVTVDSNSVVEVFDGSQGTEVNRGSARVTESVGPLAEGNPDLGVQFSGNHALEDEEQKTGIEVAELNSMVINNLPVERIEVVVQREVDVMDNEEVTNTNTEVLGTNALDGNLSCADENRCFEAEAVGGSTGPHPSGDLICEENSSVEANKQEMAAQVAENASNQVDGDERMDSHSVQENLDQGAGVTVDSSSALDVSDVFQASGIEVVKVECPAVITESLVEQIQVIGGGEVAMVDSEEVLEMREVVLGTDTLGGYPSSLEENQSMGAHAVGKSAESHGSMDLSVADEKQEMVAQISEELSSQLDANERLDSYTVEENLNEEAFVTVDSNSFAEVYDGFPATAACATQHNEGESGSAQVTESVSSVVDGNLGLEFRVNESHASDEGKETRIEIVEAGCSMVINELQVEQIQVGGGEKDLESRAVGGSTESFPNGNLSCEENTSMKAEKQDTVVQVDEPVSDQVNGVETMDSCPVNDNLDEGVYATIHSTSLSKIPDVSEAVSGSTGSFPNGNLSHEVNTFMEGEKQDMAPQAGTVSDEVDRVETMDSCPVNENLDKAVCATVDSSSLSKIPDGSQDAGACSSLCSEYDPDFNFLNECVGALVDVHPDSGAQDALGDEGRKTGIEVVKEGGLTKTNGLVVEQIHELAVEQIQVIVAGEVAEVDSEDVSKVKDIFSGTDALDVNPPRPEQNQNLGAEAVDGNPDSDVQVAEGHAVEDEELEYRINDVDAECSTATAEPLVDRNPDSEVQVTEGHTLEDYDHIDNVDGGELAVLENKKVLETECVDTGTNTLDGTSSGPEKNQSLQAVAVGGSAESYPSGDLICDVNTSMQDEKHEMVAQVAEVVSNLVDGDPAEENPIEDDYVIVDSNSLAEVSNESQTAVSCAPSAESAGYSLDGTLDSVVEATKNHASEDENQKSGAVKAGCSEIYNEPLVEQNEVVGCEVTVVENEEASKMKDGVSGTDLLDGSSSCPEKDQSWEAETISQPVEDPIRGPCVTVDSSLVDVVVDWSKATGESASLFSKAEPYPARDTETVGYFAGVYLDSEVQRPAAVLHEDQNVATHVSEVDTFPGVVNQNSEVIVATESAGGSSKAEGSQIMESHVPKVAVSEASVNECIVSTPDEDLGTDDEVVKEAIYPPEGLHGKGGELKEMEGDVEFFELDCLDEVQTDDAIDVGDSGNNKIEIGEQIAGFEQAKSMEQHLEKAEALKSEPTATYHLTPEKEGEFSISDLVWGKVRSHPWWPGQIFNSSDASERAMKYHKKDNFLVAYFGDQTFAWNEASAMKPFRTHFSQMEKQNSLESFRVAIDGALDEVRRRVELGMACSCTPEAAYAKVKSQVIENHGIREEARRRDGLDKNLSGTSFQPDDLVQYIKELALYPRGGGDRLELAIARAQLLAFYRLKGHFRLPEFHVYRGLSESDLDISPSRERKSSEEMAEPATPFSENEEHGEQAASIEVKLKNQDNTSRKRKHIPEDNLCSSRKERSLSDLMAGKKPDNDGHNHADVESPAPQSFKVGECIRRIASQLTGAPPILKSSGESLQTHEGSHRRGVAIPKEYSFPDEMLSQLCLAARDPMKGYSFLTIIIGFFSDFRNSISLDRASSRKHKKSEQVGVGNTGTRKSFNSKISSAETFDFEDTNDSYWTDRIIQNTSDEQTADKNHDRKEETELETEKDDICAEPGNSLQLVECKEQNLDGECDLTLSKSSRKNRKRKGGSRVGTSVEDGDPENSLHNSDPDLSMKKPRKPRKKKGEWLETPTDKDGDQLNNVDRGHEKNSPTALLLSFTEPYSVPSEANLNKIFRRFGPLKELETEVVRETNSARVVFKTRNDAEVAFSSAGKFSIFGPVVVSYQLSSFPLAPSIASLCATPQGREDATSVEWNTT
ncbi:PWWP domain [Macleaya cordata]|uniref:PWWP domain n=1 Tax=Macleaya cordata TaxID=56857 RepID=A0A200QHE2_MACCD|nr:PWWP domain [Macleaya cordata]